MPNNDDLIVVQQTTQNFYAATLFITNFNRTSNHCVVLTDLA